MLAELMNFVVEMAPKIGVISTGIIMVVMVIIVYIFKMNKQKDEIIMKLFDRLEKQADESKDVLGSAIGEIKSANTQTIKELSGLAIKIETIVDLVKVLLYKNVDGSDPNNDEPSPKKTTKKKQRKEETEDDY